ncbi:MAG: GWxTD domain-containing protein [Acidobacteria bacterium]|nr:GWxTD domain-containing protein [Acidobacteriota bacterium]
MSALPALLSGLVAAVVLALGGAPDIGAQWRSTPARWLMEPAELRVWRNLESPQEAEDFFNRFWQRRNPDPRRDGNPNRDLFEQRCSEANALFAGEERKGVLTPRGRVFLLLGPPSALGQEYRRAPKARMVAARGRRAPETRMLLVESWSWRPEDLSPSLRRELKKRGWKLDLEVQFVLDEDTYTLLEGEALLELAVRSWLRQGQQAMRK